MVRGDLRKTFEKIRYSYGRSLRTRTMGSAAALYCQALIQNPQDTILILISDLYEGGNREEMLQRVAALSSSGVQMIALLALSDKGAPAFDHNIAAALAGFCIPAFACTPDRFPDLMAAAIERRDLARWASEEEAVKIQWQTD